MLLVVDEKQKMDQIYDKLVLVMNKHMNNEEIDMIELAYLVGAVEAMRRVNGYRVPEIEYAYIVLNRTCNRRYEECI